MNKIKHTNQIDLDRIIDEYTPYVKTVINNMVGDNLSYEDKEEILTDTFFILWKNKNTKINHFEAYLAGITRNLVKEKFKKSSITYDIEDYSNVIEIYDEIELFSDEREKLNKLEIGYKALNKQDFDILTMFYYSSKSIKDIAKTLRLSETNVKTKLSRIRKRLKKYLI